MQYKLEELTLQSRRGDYNTVKLVVNPLRFTPRPLKLNNPRHVAVIDEVSYAAMHRLGDHKYWLNEPTHWIQTYQDFYNELFELKWLHKNEDRHSLVVSKECCLTLVQYHNHRLIAYSRSTDMRNGYFSDKLLLHLLAQHITNDRPDCQVVEIEWHIAIPHVYKNQNGVARLLERTKEV